MLNFNKITTPLILAATLIASNALAHSPLVSSKPANGELLEQAPSAISLSFKSAVKLVQIHLKSQTIDHRIKPKAVAELDQHIVLLPKLTAGEYTAAWRALGHDGHLMKGKIKFTIAP